MFRPFVCKDRATLDLLYAHVVAVVNGGMCWKWHQHCWCAPDFFDGLAPCANLDFGNLVRVMRLDLSSKCKIVSGFISISVIFQRFPDYRGRESFKRWDFLEKTLKISIDPCIQTSNFYLQPKVKSEDLPLLSHLLQLIWGKHRGIPRPAELLPQDRPFSQSTVWK